MGKPAFNPAQLQRLAGRFGDAAVDPSLWPDIMEDISAAAGATGAVLLQSDARTTDVPRTASVNDMINHYFAAGWHARDIRAERAVPLLMRGEKVVIDQDILTPEEMGRSDYYQEAVLPFRFRWFAGIGFAAGPALWALVIQRTPAEGPFEYADKHELAKLSLRLTETATLSKAVGRAVLSGITDALSLVGQPALAVDRIGLVLEANAKAEQIFDDAIRVCNRRLVVRDQRAKAALERLVEQLRATPDTAAVAADPIIVSRRSQRPLVIRVLPVDGAARSPFLGARALLLLQPLERPTGPDSDVLSKLFGLSPAEARLASVIARGTPPPQAGKELGIAIETVRTQLKAVFAKTETHRQAELVALLSRV